MLPKFKFMPPHFSRIYFEDGERVNCEWPGVFVDNDEYVEINDCYLM